MENIQLTEGFGLRFFVLTGAFRISSFWLTFNEFHYSSLTSGRFLTRIPLLVCPQQSIILQEDRQTVLFVLSCSLNKVEVLTAAVISNQSFSSTSVVFYQSHNDWICSLHPLFHYIEELFLAMVLPSSHHPFAFWMR